MTFGAKEEIIINVLVFLSSLAVNVHEIEDGAQRTATQGVADHYVEGEGINVR